MSPSQNPRISLPNMAVPVVRVALSQMQRTYFFHEIIYVFFCVCLNREAQPREFVFDDLCQFLETNSWSLKTEFLEILNFRSRATGPCMSRREIKIDVWKYIRPYLMGLGAVLEKKLAHPNRELSHTLYVCVWVSYTYTYLNVCTHKCQYGFKFHFFHFRIPSMFKYCKQCPIRFFPSDSC